MYNEVAPAPVDPYSDAYNTAAPPSSAPLDMRDRDAPPPRGRSRSRSPPRYRSPQPPQPFSRRRSPASSQRAKQAPVNPNPSNVLGVFGLSIRTTERDLDEEFSRFGRVEKVTIVYDQRSDRSRGFGFIKMSTVEEATRCIQELNGIELNGRRIRVDFSVTDRAHAPTPGQYMGHRRNDGGGRDRREPYRDAYRDRDRDGRRGGDYDRYDRDRADRYDRERYDRDRHDRDRDRDRDPYGRDGREWRERRSPPPRAGGGAGRYSPERRRRSYSRSPPRGSGSSPVRGARDYEAPPPPSSGPNGDHRW